MRALREGFWFPRHQGGVMRAVAWVMLFVLAWLGGSAQYALSGTDFYDYDPLGRLIRWIDASGQTTEYVYDPVGNLLEVRGNGLAAPPAVTHISPGSLRRGETRQILVQGANLSGCRLEYAPDGFVLSGFMAQGNQAGFQLRANDDVPLGEHVFRLTNGLGSATFVLRVDPILPTLRLEPTPLAIPPDAALRSFVLRLSTSDSIDHVVHLSTADATIATVSPSSLTLPAGQTEARASVAGLKSGTTRILATSDTLDASGTPVYVTSEYVGVNTSHAFVLGVVKESVDETPPGTTNSQLVSAGLGVIRGSALLGVAPRNVAIGTGPLEWVIHGRGLQNVTAVSLEPATGLTLGTPEAMADGTAVRVPLTVAADAPLGYRILTLSGTDGPYPPAWPDADRLNITPQLPEIHSIAPLFARPGDTLALTVRGVNLKSAARVLLQPGERLTLADTPSVNAEGTQLTVGVTVAPDATAGAHVAQVETPAGISSETASPANLFTVVSDIQGDVGPVNAAQLGIVKLEAGTPAQRNADLGAAAVGIAKGPVVTTLNPAVGSQGESLTLVAHGQDLAAVDQVILEPADGLTLGTPQVAGDGRRVEMSIGIDPAAARTMRRLRLLAAGQDIPAVPGADRFQVVAPLPQVDSLTPLHLVAGAAPVTLTVRGRNLHSAQALLVTPDTGLTVGVPVVNGGGTELTVGIAADASAPLGARLAQVRTPAGDSGDVAGPANTLHVIATPGRSEFGVASLLGVVLDDGTGPAPATSVAIPSGVLGIVLDAPPPPPTVTATHLAAPGLGVSVGNGVTDLRQPYMAPGTDVELVIRGIGLDQVASVGFTPAAGLTPGALSVAPDGMEGRLPLSIDATAAVGAYRIDLLDAQGQALPFAQPSQSRLLVAHPPRIDSIEPILADQGDVFTLLIRGAHLTAGRVSVEPADGITLGSTASANPAGTELTLPVAVSADAPVGARVFRVETAGGQTPAEPHPANTFTVYPQP